MGHPWRLCLVFVGGAALFYLGQHRERRSGIASILCIAACGQAIVLILGGIEFSFGSSVALASVVTVTASPASGRLLAPSPLARVVFGIGAINGTLIGRFELPSFLVTLEC